MPVLEHPEIEKRLAGMSGWSLAEGQISKTFMAATFHRAVAFVTQIGMLAEVADHHPDIDIRYNKVTVRLSTHSEGGITEKDFALAEAMELAFV